MTDYARGTVVNLEALFEVDGTPTDPDTLTVTVQDPDGVSTDYVYLTDAEVVRDSAGAFHMDLATLDGELGRWTWRFQGTGSAEGVFEGEFYLVSKLDLVPQPPAYYCDLEDVLNTYDQRPASAGRQEAIQVNIGVATEELIRVMGKDYFRHPIDPDDDPETWLADGDGSGILHIHEGFVSIDKIELLHGTDTFVEAATGFMFRGANPRRNDPIPQGEPYYHIVFNRRGSYVTFPYGYETVRLTGVRGWPTIPADLRKATATRARQLTNADKTFGGSPGTYESGGSPQMYEMLPDTYWRFLKAENHRFWCHL
jgi:hypothetical protein